MKTMTETKQLWTCPKCQRQFERQGQSHSCKPFPLEQHFKGKPNGKLLFEKLKQAIEKQLGSFKIESLECCIHFFSTSTFAAVKISKDKILVEFTLNHKIESDRISKFVQLSAHRNLYYIEIQTKKDIDEELIQWIKEAHDKK
jgi:uncharacterized CHY-type Zn-finger protein